MLHGWNSNFYYYLVYFHSAEKSYAVKDNKTGFIVKLCVPVVTGRQ